MAFINGTSSKDILQGTPNNDIILGYDGNDIIYGRGGNDTFFQLDNYYNVKSYWGTGGNDTIYGGSGNDKYLVESKKDIVVEYSKQGNDSVYSIISYHLPNNVENGYLIIGGNKNLYGNGLNNYLNGNCYSNYITGEGGNDTISGGGGSGGGIDTLYGGAGNDRIMASTPGNYLYGGSGNDTLIGSTGNDTLYGGSGSDHYKTTISGELNSFGNDIIRDYDTSSTKYSTSKEHDTINLTNFNLNNLTFKALDKDNDHKLDALLISSKYGSIAIDKYFDDSNSSIVNSHYGIGEIYDIWLNNGQHLHFPDIQGLLG